jgi:hypothetical protein
MPAGRFVLLRQRTEVCAIRFLEARSGLYEDEREETQYAKYE